MWHSWHTNKKPWNLRHFFAESLCAKWHTKEEIFGTQTNVVGCQELVFSVQFGKEANVLRVLSALSALEKTRRFCKKCKIVGLRVLSALEANAEVGLREAQARENGKQK